MSLPHSEQQGNGSRRSSLVTSSSFTSSKRHHQRSSLVTTTTSSSSSSRAPEAHHRQPAALFQPAGASSPFNSTPDENPPNDLRRRLADRQDRRAGARMMFASRLHRGPQSAPATLSHPSYECVAEENNCNSSEHLTGGGGGADTSADSRLDRPRASNLQPDLQQPQQPPILQVTDQAHGAAANEDPRRAEGVVEVKRSSSSASSSPSAASSAGSSPVSSRQSSDCQAKQPEGAGPLAVASPAHHSDSSDSSSPRTLVRRRTVRRVHHHHHHHHQQRQEQEESETNSQRPRSRVATTTYTTSQSDEKPPKGTGGSLEGPASQQSGHRLTCESLNCSQLSTSKSSSKIATVTSSTSSSSTSKRHHQKKSSSHSSSKQREEQEEEHEEHEEQAEAATVTTTITNRKQDLNSSMADQRHQSLFERRNRSSTAELAGRLGVAAGEEAAQISKESTSSSSFNASTSRLRQQSSNQVLANRQLAGNCSRDATTVSSSASSSCETSLSRLATSSKKLLSTTTLGARGLPRRQLCELEHQACDLSTSSSSHFKSASSSSSAELFRSARAAAALADRQRHFLGPALNRDGSASGLLFSSPEVESLVQEIGTDFAELENSTSLMIREQHATRSVNGPTSRLFGPMQPPRVAGQPSYAPLALRAGGCAPDTLDALIQETKSTIRELENKPPAAAGLSPVQRAGGSSSSPVSPSQSNAKLQALMERAQRNGSTSDDPTTTTSYTCRLPLQAGDEPQPQPMHRVSARRSPAAPLNESDRCKAVMNESIERIDQRMSDLCRKLESCNDTQKAIDLLKIMIQMIEKAWSVPVCGDDLGFKLCNSLRLSGGLAIILGFVHEAGQRSLLETGSKSLEDELQAAAGHGQQRPQHHQHQQHQNHLNTSISASQTADSAGGQQAAPVAKQLRLNLSKVHSRPQLQPEEASAAAHQPPSAADREELPAAATKDDDSDILTSDLGLDSASVESLSYASAQAGCPADGSGADQQQQQQQRDQRAGDVDDEQLRRVRKEELVFLSAHLLSQSLTSENRDYIVRYGLDPVIKLACNFTTMKSNQRKRLLKRSALMRRNSAKKQQLQQQRLQEQAQESKPTGDPQQAEAAANGDAKGREVLELDEQAAGEPSALEPEQSDMHSAIGTEILQHLFKHSEETCSRMVALGALQAILYGCRSSHVETLRHCASALANLALYGGPDGQQTMIEQKAHVWLFPLAFNEDDNVQYYACLAIVVLAANQEIEADVLKSSTLDLVEPFVTLHEPRKFAESTTSHIHGQSAGWLKKLLPLLDSRREEARNLACFHFAMEAYIKREQGQTSLFREIGSLEALRRAGSSPIAIASKFACQALRLIGEKEPHKLSQQVPLWTVEDVCEWVSQIGFERFRAAFCESHVDGDLLLQLDEEMLKFDIKIENGIIRRRFLRELSQLKRIADYSSADKSNLGQVLINSTSLLSSCCPSSAGHHHPAGQQLAAGASSPLSGASARNEARDFLQYIYPIIQLGVTRDNIHLVDCDQLLAECKISNALHRYKLANSIRELQERISLEAASKERNSLGGGDHQKTLDVFVSYRRSTGSQLASLLKVHLQLRGFSVFIDVERLEAGKFDNNLLDSIKTAKNFILVLSPSALDRCVGDHECKDWVHKEIVAALASNCNIIPIIDNFHWPDPEQLPEDMRSISYFNGIRWIHDYQDACVDKVERFIRGELSNSSILGSGGGGSVATAGQATAGSVSLSLASSSMSQAGAYCQYQSRLGGGVSTPSIVATTPSICSGSNLGSLPGGGAINNPQAPGSDLAGKNSSAKSSNHDHQNASSNAQEAGQHHPLANYANHNPYLQHSAQQLQCGNVNPNIRLR